MKIEDDASLKFNSYQIRLSCDDSIVHSHVSSLAIHDNSNVVTDSLDSTYNDGSQIRRTAMRRNPTRFLLGPSEDENIRGIESASLLTPIRALWYQNLRVIGQSSSHETTDMSAQQNFFEGAFSSGCLLSSSGVSASCCYTHIGECTFQSVLD
ncbi:hypothetical protein NPIL_600011 [Nephila pilipes]|uniref:Uncharacterized protein n=1 Tax=Nephila pilipes TaxID=299642 RepID=A0A8X6TW63_NEPPI|nr:hypothetical protein NPIL_600011 [Nephila pilipes]